MPYLLAVKEPDAPVPIMDTMIREEEQGDVFDEDSVPEQVPDLQHTYLIIHAKVYAIAEQ
jgi:hypothetical protein